MTENRTTDRSASRRHQIHEAALICFERKGFHLATMDDIVTESGLSKGTLYWYFSSKKELFLSLLSDVMSQFGTEWESLMATPNAGAIEKLKISLAFFKTEMMSLSGMVSMLLEAWALLRHDEDVADRLRSFYVAYVDLMAQLIKDGLEEGVFFVHSPYETAIVIVTLFDGLLLALSTNLDLSDWSQILDAAEVMVLRALGVGSESIA